MYKKSLTSLSALAVLVSIGIAIAGMPPGDDAFTRLMDGNKRFTSGPAVAPDLSAARRKELAAGQRPFAIVVTCSDSRVAPELIFSKGLGDLFVIRVAGNVLDPVALGSIEYAAEHLHTPLLVLLGHEQCGAVTAAVNTTGTPEGNIGAIVKKILPAVERARKQGGSGNEIVANAIRLNVFQSYDDLLKQSAVLKHLIEKDQLRVVKALYHLESGVVEVLQGDAAAPEAKEHKDQPKKRKVPVGC